MTPSKTYELPEHPPRSVVREGDIETDFIGKLGSLKYTVRPDIRIRP